MKIDRNDKRDLNLNAVNLDSKHHPIEQQHENFFKDIIHDNKVKADSYINLGAFTGEMIASTKNYNNAKKTNNETKKENAIKEEKELERAKRIEETKRYIMSDECKGKQLKTTDYRQNCSKVISVVENPEEYGIDCTQFDVDHLLPMPKIKTNDNGILDLLLGATENGTFEEVKELINDEDALVWIFAQLNRSKQDRYGITPEDFPKYKEYVEKTDICNQYKNLINEKKSKLKKMEAEELLKYEAGKVYTKMEMRMRSYFRMLVTTTIYNMCDFFTKFVEKHLIDYCMCRTNEPLDLTRIMNKLKDKFINEKNNTVNIYKDLVEKIKLPTLKELFDMLKGASFKVFDTAKSIVDKIKNTIKSTVSLVKGIFSSNNHERNKALVGAAATFLAGAFTNFIERIAGLIPLIKTVIGVIITTLAKIALTIVYTIMDLNDKYGKVMERYNTFAI